jgi:hypothetical protein
MWSEGWMTVLNGKCTCVCVCMCIYMYIYIYIYIYISEVNKKVRLLRNKYEGEEVTYKI